MHFISVPRNICYIRICKFLRYIYIFLDGIVQKRNVRIFRGCDTPRFTLPSHVQFQINHTRLIVCLDPSIGRQHRIREPKRAIIPEKIYILHLPTPLPAQYKIRI